MGDSVYDDLLVNVASLRSAFTITGTGVHVPPERAFTIAGMRTAEPDFYISHLFGIVYIW